MDYSEKIVDRIIGKPKKGKKYKHMHIDCGCEKEDDEEE